MTTAGIRVCHDTAITTMEMDIKGHQLLASKLYLASTTPLNLAEMFHDSSA
ncbi:hypothetical protein PP707_01965 [Acetobacter pasteurianus]|nr:hypothetical protein [Acetobacter pasteurianus]